MLFENKNARRSVWLIQFEVKLQKATEITYLEARNKQGRYCVTYLQVLKVRKKVG